MLAIAVRRARSIFLSCMILLTAAGAGLAVQPDEVLSDTALEARARTLSAELRCLVCQNQSIDDSDAPLARDLRLIVRERLVAGDSDQDVLDFVVARYGEFVLLRPRVAWHTALLWLGPALILLIGAGLLLRRARTAQVQETRASASRLSEDEEARLRAVLDDNTPDDRDPAS